MEPRYGKTPVRFGCVGITEDGSSSHGEIPGSSDPRSGTRVRERQQEELCTNTASAGCIHAGGSMEKYPKASSVSRHAKITSRTRSPSRTPCALVVSMLFTSCLPLNEQRSYALHVSFTSSAVDSRTATAQSVPSRHQCDLQRDIILLLHLSRGHYSTIHLNVSILFTPYYSPRYQATSA